MAKLVVLHNAGQKRPTGDVGPINFLPVSYLQSLSWSIPRVKTQKYGLNDVLELVRGTWWGPEEMRQTRLLWEMVGSSCLSCFLEEGRRWCHFEVPLSLSLSLLCRTVTENKKHIQTYSAPTPTSMPMPTPTLTPSTMDGAYAGYCEEPLTILLWEFQTVSFIHLKS